MRGEKMESNEVAANMFIRLPGIPQILIEKTEGVYLYTSDGARILDASGGPMAANIGHGRTEVAEAAARSITQVSYILPVFASPQRIELTKRIKRRLPPELSRIYYCSGGSEANEVAIKFARQYDVVAGRGTRTKVITRKHGYHGNTMLTVSIGGIEERRRDFLPMLWPSPRAEDCYCFRCPFKATSSNCDLECAHDVERAIKAEGPDTVAAFLAEPIVASALGAVAPPPGYWNVVREACDRHGVMLIVDEVVTGFGRTGKPMGMDHYGVVPDISVFAKGVSGGYAPLAGMAVREDLVKAFEDRGEEFASLYTYSAHPLSMAVGAAVQDIIDREDLMTRAAVMGEYLGRKLERLRELPIVGDVRGRGLLWAVELVKDKKTMEPFPAADKMKTKVAFIGLLKGVFLYPGYYRDEQGRGDHIMLAPPFIITEEQVDTIVDTLEGALRELAKG